MLQGARLRSRSILPVHGPTQVPHVFINQDLAGCCSAAARAHALQGGMRFLRMF